MQNIAGPIKTTGLPSYNENVYEYKHFLYRKIYAQRHMIADQELNRSSEFYSADSPPIRTLQDFPWYLLSSEV